MTATRIESRSTTGVPDQIGTHVIASLGLFMTALDTLVVTTAAAQRGRRYRGRPPTAGFIRALLSIWSRAG